MSWYWLLVLAVLAIFALSRLRRGGKQEQADEPDEFAFLERYRQQHADADRELSKVVAVIEALPVSDEGRRAGNTLTRAQLSDSIRKFLESKVVLEWNSSTKMTHVVVAPAKVTVFAKLQPTEPAAAMRIFTRMGEDAWAVETRRADDMDDAIQAANREALAT